MSINDLLYIVPNSPEYNEIFMHLIRKGFIPFWIPSKKAFFELLNEQTDIKLIIIDDSILDGDLSIIQKIKFSPKTENSGILFITSSEEEANKAKFLGADHIMLKPISSEKVAENLQEILSKHNFYQQNFDVQHNVSLNFYPSLLVHFQKIADLFKVYRNVRVYAFELYNIPQDELLQSTEQLISNIKDYLNSQIPLKGKTLLFPFSENSFIIMIFYPDNFTKNVFLELIIDIEKILHGVINKYHADYSYGFSDSSFEIIQNYEITIYSLLKKAFEVIWDTKHNKFSKYIGEFNHIITNKDVWTEFQPIINLENNTIWGFEGLSRGPANTPWQAPEYLFEMAFKFDRVVEIEKICLEKTIEKFLYLEYAKRLFLNIHPDALEPLLDDIIAIQNKYNNIEIVVEVTEKKFIQDFEKFQSFFHIFRENNVKIALDDVGSGYSSLQYLVELNIDYFKIDMSLVQGIYNNYLKESVVKALCDIANEKKSLIIAEGVENTKDLSVIKRLGIKLVQGFLFGRPSIRPTVSFNMNHDNNRP